MPIRKLLELIQSLVVTNVTFSKIISNVPIISHAVSPTEDIIQGVSRIVIV